MNERITQDAEDIGIPLKSARRRVSKIGNKSDRQLRQFAIQAARLLNDLHCTDILVLDVRGRSQNVDYVVIATGTSDRQIRSVGESVQELGQESGMVRFGREIDTKSSWVIIDFSDIVVHVFEPITRAHYDLEMMWGDAPRLRWRRTSRVKKT